MTDFVLSFPAKNLTVQDTEIALGNDHVACASGCALVTQSEQSTGHGTGFGINVIRGPNRQIIGSSSQDETSVRHLSSPHKETVDDSGSHRNQLVGVSGRLLPGYTALHL